jgi:hypothetical protein
MRGRWRALCGWLVVAAGCGCAGEPAEPDEGRVLEAPELVSQLEHLRAGNTVLRVPLAAAHDFLPRGGDHVVHEEGPVQCPAAPDDDLLPPERRTCHRRQRP